MQHPAPLAIHVNRRGHDRADFQALCETRQHQRVFPCIPANVALARLVDFYHAPPVRYGQPVHANLALPPTHRGIANAEDDQAGYAGLVHERVHLVGGKGARD